MPRPLAAHVEVPGRKGYIAVADGAQHVVETHLGRHHFVDVYGYFHFQFLGPPYIHLLDFRAVFDLVLQLFGEFFELLYRVVAGDIHIHDRERLGQVQVKYIGFDFGAVENWPVFPGFFCIHFVLYLQLGILYADILIKLHHDHGVVFL